MTDINPLIEDSFFSDSETEDTIWASYWKTGYKQDPGSRKEQQDRIGLATGKYHGKTALLAVLADGMGGMKNGAEFSRITVDYHCEHFQEILDQVEPLSGVLLALALKANAEANKIYDEDNPGGTTLISALLIDHCFYSLSVGDSRIVLFRKNDRLNRFAPLQINREHLLGAALDERAWMGFIAREDAEENMFRNSLTSCIGLPKVKRLDFSDYPTRLIPGDRLLLMSDGVFKTVPETELAGHLENDPQTAANLIIEDVCSRGAKSQDNMSVIIIENRGDCYF